MTESFYHIDRYDQLSTGDVLPSFEVFMPPGHPADYPNGVSKFGKRYIEQNTQPNMGIEFFFEQLRLQEFSERPSRFQVYFGVEDVRAGRQWLRKLALDRRNSCRDNYAWPVNVYEVEADSVFKADMGNLRFGNFRQAYHHAREYWKGNVRGSDPHWEHFLEPPVEVLGLTTEIPFADIDPLDQ